MIKRLLFYLFYVLIINHITSCASPDINTIRTETKNWSEEQLYQKAKLEFKKEKFTKAIKYYSVLRIDYPNGKYAPISLLEMAKAYFYDDQIELSLAELNNFMALYPGNQYIPDALYFKGDILYQDSDNFITTVTGQDPGERDIDNLKQAYSSFMALATNYPNYHLVIKAKEQINNIVNAMARRELYTARYYMTINACLAGIHHANLIINNERLGQTIYKEEALAIKIVAADCLLQYDVAKQTKLILSANYPKSKYLKKNWDASSEDMPWYKFWR